jgi:hypothetical protein
VRGGRSGGGPGGGMGGVIELALRFSLHLFTW